MVEIKIIDNGKEQTLQGDCVYGCMIENTTKENGEQGLRCMSFLSGGDVNIMMLPELTATSVAKVIEALCERTNDPLLAPILVGAAVSAMDNEACRLMESTEDLRREMKEEMKDGGN